MDISVFKGPCFVILGVIALGLFIGALASAATIPSGVAHKKIFLVCVAVTLAGGVIMISIGINLIALSLSL